MVGADDGGNTIKVRVSFTDDAGNEETLTSDATAVVAAPTRPNNPATGAPTISGAAQVGETLTAETSGIDDDDGLSNPTFSYQWIRGDGTTDSDIQDATDSTYALLSDDSGKAIKVRVTFTDDAGNEETLTSDAIAVVAAATRPNNPATGAPTISGTAQVGETLTADTSGIDDDDGLSNPTFSYQWIRSDGTTDSDIQDATDSTYTLVSQDSGKAIKVRVTFTDDAGNEETLTSPPLDPSRPYGLTTTVSGRTVVLNWKPPVVFPYLYDYQILRHRPELGETEPLVYVDTGTDETTYTDTDVEPGVLYEYSVKAANFFGRLSKASEPVQIQTPTWTPVENSPATGAPTISGTAQVGQTLTADTSDIADADGLDKATFTYRWLADDTDISGATGSTYTLTGSDAGKAIKVRVAFTDDAGNQESLTSAETSAVAAALIPLTASVHDAPESHDGENAFTFELRLSEEPVSSFSYVTLRDHAFTVTGGSVVNARRLNKPSNIRWEITVTPDGNGDVTIVLPVTSNCEAQAAICTGDGRMLSTRVELTVAGPGG